MIRRLAAERAEILSVEQFRLFFLGSIISRTGNAIQFVAMSWLIMHTASLAETVALVSASQAAAGFFAAPVSGILADRVDPRIAHRATDLVCAAIAALVPLSIVLSFYSVELALLCAFCLALGNRVSVVFSRVILTHTVPERLLLDSNSTLSLANQLGGFLGAIIGGLTVNYVSEQPALWLNCFSFFASAYFLGLMLARKPQLHEQHLTATDAWIENVRIGLSYILSKKDTLKLYCMLAMLMALLPFLNSLLPLYVSKILNADASFFGLIDAMFGIGGMLASLIIPLFARRIDNRKIFMSGMLMLSICLFALPHVLFKPLSLCLYFIIGLSFHSWVVLMTMAQKSVAVQFQGRAQAFFEILFAMTGFVASLLAFMGASINLAGTYQLAALVLYCGVTLLFMNTKSQP